MKTDITIYLLEDNSDDIYLFKQIVNADDSCRYITVDFASVTSLQKSLEYIIPDLLVIDLNISESLGLQTLKDVKEISQDLPIIVLTGSDETLGLQAIKLGAQDYLLKDEVSTHSLKRAISYARERSVLYAALEELAIKDKLTDLYNRAAFDHRLENFEADYVRYQRSYAAILFDINGFKLINDNYGHGVGDIILQQVAHRLKMFNRASDFICRFGGDEFLLIAPSVTCAESLTEIIENKRAIIDDKYALKSPDNELITVDVSIAIGGAIRGLDAKSPYDLVQAADKNMYADKGNKSISKCW
ncbi:GGDEF domain-containing response regulator [Paraglaciecola sp. L3A3]|uniref:GGDEF domain-containing protein n=1 Tax=Paraglaciecola sp. L3A3 TaxID=2686358 RepID=UPI00131EB4D1|nr:GGDEF domain-containing response regulator [Paraglaciecola sp. L3A3]